VPESAPPELAPARLAERLEGSFGRGLLTWGTDDGAQALVDLADGARRAEQAIAVGRALHGAGGVHDAEALAPFMLLHGLAADEAARGEVARLLEPILSYDRSTSRDLLLTLAVYLEEHGNTSSAARRLHLNRHSLLYRLRKIETLTGRSLDRHEDRFLLDLSLRVHRMTAA
jgi:purine catabolism regulator